MYPPATKQPLNSDSGTLLVVLLQRSTIGSANFFLVFLEWLNQRWPHSTLVPCFGLVGAFYKYFKEAPTGLKHCEECCMTISDVSTCCVFPYCQWHGYSLVYHPVHKRAVILFLGYAEKDRCNACTVKTFIVYTKACWLENEQHFQFESLPHKKHSEPCYM